MLENRLSKLLLYFTKEDVEFTLDRVITDAEWDAFLSTFDVIPTETRDCALVALAAEYEAFAQRCHEPDDASDSQRPMLGLSGRL
jgi:hypothetical protein